MDANLVSAIYTLFQGGETGIYTVRICTAIPRVEKAMGGRGAVTVFLVYVGGLRACGGKIVGAQIINHCHQTRGGGEKRKKEGLEMTQQRAGKAA